MIINLAQRRQLPTSPTVSPEFDLGDPRRLHHLSLEQQKKRAKELLKQVRTHDATAIERWQRNSARPLATLLELRLSDAQGVIARENGFRKWEDLKAHTDHIRIAQQAVRAGRPSALDGAQRTLHIRCGTDILHKLAIAGFNGDFLWFGDPYIFGPVPSTTSLQEFVRIRSESINTPFQELFTMYQDLEQAGHYPRVALWNEYDVFDQLILAKLLDFFSDPVKRPARLQFINTTHFPGVQIFNGLGQLPAEALRVLWNDFQEVSEQELQAGQQAWKAITSASPVELLDFVSTDSAVLPIMRRALKRHLQELPSVKNGLGLSEQVTLQILAEKGPMNAARLFGWFQNHYDPLPGMGDTGYWKILRGLASVEAPALRIDERADSPQQWHVELLPFGTQLLNNNADWLVQNQVRRWVGGVFINSRAETPWRLEDARNAVLRR
ncbi:MAG: hypothetical protein HY080_02270 [Gammaproteobacteria bacterium]|nr:hypothetical protein [Gammaproteobacteria bacterium]